MDTINVKDNNALIGMRVSERRSPTETQATNERKQAHEAFLARRDARKATARVTDGQQGGIDTATNLRTDALIGEAGGFRVILETFRYDPNTKEVWLLGMGGQATAVRGVWAKLLLGAFLRVAPLSDDAILSLSGKPPELGAEDTTHISGNDELYVLAGGPKGWRSSQSRPGHNGVGRTMLHMVMLPPCADLASGPDAFLLVQDDRDDLSPSRLLLQHLVARSGPPIVAEWEDDLWNWATSRGHVRELAGVGRWAYLAHVPDNVLIREFLAQRVTVCEKG